MRDGSSLPDAAAVAVGEATRLPSRPGWLGGLAGLLVQLLLLPLPWRARRALLARLLGWRLAPDARIGLSLIAARRVSLGRKARVRNFTLVGKIEALHLADGASLGSWNLVGGAPLASGRFPHCPHRRPQLVLGPGAAITHRHLLDCSDSIEVGAFTIVAGYRSQILTHGIDVAAGRQTTAPVRIGERCMIGSGVLLLAGVEIADRVVVAAGAVVGRPLADAETLYGGVPARPIKPLDPAAAFFTRKDAFVE